MSEGHTISEEQVRDAIRPVTDPEIDMSILDLGLVYGIEIDQEQKSVRVKMPLTSPMCPAGPEIAPMGSPAALLRGGEGLPRDLGLAAGPLFSAARGGRLRPPPRWSILFPVRAVRTPRGGNDPGTVPCDVSPDEGVPGDVLRRRVPCGRLAPQRSPGHGGRDVFPEGGEQGACRPVARLGQWWNPKAMRHIMRHQES